MKTTLLFVITALFALAADEPKKPELTDSQKLRLSKIETDAIEGKSAYHEADAKAMRALLAMNESRARSDAAKRAIVKELNIDPACDIVKRQPTGPDGKTLQDQPPDWFADCPTPPEKDK
jgi:hypothetical protein